MSLATLEGLMTIGSTDGVALSIVLPKEVSQSLAGEP